MSQLTADFAASAPASSHSRNGRPFLSSRLSSSQGVGSRGSRSKGQPQQQHHVPPLKAATGSSSSAARPSIVTQEQRDALHVSAFGFRSQPPRTYEDAAAPASTVGGAKRAVAAAQARSRYTVCHDDAEVVVAAPEKDSTRFHLCVQALAEGCVQSYMHLFYISHRDPVCVDPLSQTCFVVPEDRLRWVQENLSSIEVLRRQSEFTEVLTRCQRLADYFEGERDLEEAAWHYDAALKYAGESLEPTLELDTRARYAAFLERRGQLVAAVDMLESMRSLAVAVHDAARGREACAALVRVYRALGDELAEQGRLSTDLELAKRYYERSVRYAKAVSADAQEGEGYDALGHMHELGGELDKALKYQQTFLRVSRERELRSHECRATLNVAGLEGQLGRGADAIVSLRGALQLAKDLGEAEKVCRATMQLGDMYRASGDAKAAMTCFKEAFPAAFESGKQDLVDSVRVAMGFAVGDFYFTNAGGGRGYLPIVCNDVRAQLAWMGNGEL